MFVQVATFMETAEQLEEGIRHVREEVVPSVQGASGLESAYWAIDRETGKRLSILVWDSPDAAVAAMPDVVASVQQRHSAAGLTEPQAAPTAMERFEVVAHL
jgi:hypothetical protein